MSSTSTLHRINTDPEKIQVLRKRNQRSFLRGNISGHQNMELEYKMNNTKPTKPEGDSR